MAVSYSCKLYIPSAECQCYGPLHAGLKTIWSVIYFFFFVGHLQLGNNVFEIAERLSTACSNG
jgi:hypothetical protein